MTGFHDALALKLLAKGLDVGRIRSIRTPLAAAMTTRAASASDRVKAAVQARQKELSRSIAPMVMAKMKPGYERGYAEAGTGSHRRRVAILEAHIGSESKRMFGEAVQPVMQSMLPLRKEIQRLVETICVEKSMAELREHYGMLWEATTEQSHAARLAMHPKLELAVSGACTALSRLLRSQGASDQDAAMATAAARGSMGSATGDDAAAGEWPVDETDVRRAEALKTLKENSIDLLDDSVSASTVVSRLGPVPPKIAPLSCAARS